MAEIESVPQDRLREEILADAKRQADRIVRRARQEAETIAEQAASEAKRFRDQTVEQARLTAARRADLQAAKLPVEQGRLRATHIEALLDAVRRDAAKALDPEHAPLSREALLGLIAAAAGGMAGDTLVLRLTPADRRSLTDNFLEPLRSHTGKHHLQLELGEPLAARDAGPILSDIEGRQLWDNRLSARLVRLWPLLRRALAADLQLNAMAPKREAHS